MGNDTPSIFTVFFQYCPANTLKQNHMISLSPEQEYAFISTAQTDFAQVSTMGSSLFLNCFYFCCCLNDLLPEWHNDKKMNVFPIFISFKFISLVYISLSSSLYIFEFSVSGHLQDFYTFQTQYSFPMPLDISVKCCFPHKLLFCSLGQ